MSFWALVLKNLFRQRVRTALTILGIAVGMTIIVALGAITEGFKASSTGFIRAGGADFLVAQDGASDLSFSAVPAEDAERITALPGVERAIGTLLEVSEIGGNPYFLVFGYEPEALPEEPLALTAGRLVAPGADREAMLGSRAAADLGLAVGDSLPVDGEPFEIVGLYRVDDQFRDGGAIVPLRPLQELSARQDVVTAIHVTVASGADPDQVASTVEREFPQLAAISTVDEYSKVDQGFEILDAANLAISVLAIGIGAIGVMNTMIMSV
ncbi:MAG TPA: ABC transporter permease, partial [Gaiellaceae bacterium]